MPEANIGDLWLELLAEIDFGTNETSHFAGIYDRLAQMRCYPGFFLLDRVPERRCQANSAASRHRWYKIGSGI
jgi:hypothetical protein